MKVWGVNSGEVLKIVGDVSLRKYDGNVVIKKISERGSRTKTVDFTLTIKSSKGPGTKLSRHGDKTRRVHAACWHVFYDVLLSVFEVYPNSRVQSSVEDYRGFEEFMERAENTGDHNIGSVMEPTIARHACECESNPTPTMVARAVGRTLAKMGDPE